MSGLRIGPWLLVEQVGFGPLGVLYRATDSTKTAALKILNLPMEVSLPGDLLSLRRLAHPNIAEFYEAGIHAGMPYYAREWVPGTDLVSLIKTRTNHDSAWRDHAISIAVQLCRAMNHGHRRSLLQRNLKPSNVIVMPNGQIKVTDFGVSKVLAIPPLNLPADPWVGLPFLAPEQFTGKPFTRRSDIYSLGAVLYSLVTGRPPFSAANSAEYVHKHCYVLPDRPANFVSRLPNDFDELICNLLAKDPGRRPATVNNVHEELEKLRSRLERKGDQIPWPEDVGDTNLHAPLSETTIAEVKGEDKFESEVKPLMKRMTVVLPLLLGVVGLLIFLLTRPGPPPDDLYKQGMALMATGQPTEMDRAWYDYFEPLSRKYPNAYTEEIARIKETRQINRELKKAIDQGNLARYSCESERWYYRGVAAAKLGDWETALKHWQQAATYTEEKIWPDAASRAIEEVQKSRQGR